MGVDFCRSWRRGTKGLGSFLCCCLSQPGSVLSGAATMCRPAWDESQSVLANYKGAFVANANVGFGRNALTEETAGQPGDESQAAAFQPDDGAAV